MRRDDDGEVDGVVADEGAAGNALLIKSSSAVVMRRSWSRCAVLVVRSRVCECSKRLHVTFVGRGFGPPNALRARVL